MRFEALLALFVLLATSAAQAQPASAEQLDSDNRARIEQLIKDAYNDPRVAAVIEQAQREQRSVTITLDDEGQSVAPAAAGSDDFALSAATDVKIAEAPKKKDEKSWWNAYTHLGVLLDAGVPDGVGASAVFRPWKWLHVHAGGTYNGISGGIRVGATVLPPVFFPILPTATVEYGHAFEGDANWIARAVASDPSFDNPSLKRVSYDYVNGHLGLEIGSQNRFLFYIHGGVSYVHTTIHDFQKTIDQNGANTSDTTITAKDPKANLLVPSGKIGFIVYFL